MNEQLELLPRLLTAHLGLALGESDEVVLRIEAGDEERWLTCSYAPLSDGGYVAVARDETARKKLQESKASGTPSTEPSSLSSR